MRCARLNRDTAVLALPVLLGARRGLTLLVSARLGVAKIKKGPWLSHRSSALLDGLTCIALRLNIPARSNPPCPEVPPSTARRSVRCASLQIVPHPQGRFSRLPACRIHVDTSTSTLAALPPHHDTAKQTTVRDDNVRTWERGCDLRVWWTHREDYPGEGRQTGCPATQ